MFYLIDKPLGITSFDVIRKLRKILNTKKIGHTGTLDPLATGCLLIATEKSTKLIPEVENKEKRYRFSVCLEGYTDSLDLGSPIIPSDITGFREDITIDQLEDFLVSQKTQIPPKYSALHIDGERAYTLARKGIDFEIQARNITIRDVKITDFNPPKNITIEVTLSSGGYIRSLAPMIGTFFGLEKSGYITSLRRTDIFLEHGSLGENIAQNIDNSIPIPYSILFPTIHTIEISEEIYIDIKNGKEIPSEKTTPGEEGHKYFLAYLDQYRSLCRYQDGKYRVIRNDV